MDKYAAFAISVVAIALVVGAALIIPAVGGGSGGTQSVVCDVKVQFGSTYVDTLLNVYQMQYTATAHPQNCHTKTILGSLVNPLRNFNLVGLSVTPNSLMIKPETFIDPANIVYAITLTSPDGSLHGPYQVTFTIPSFTVNYPIAWIYTITGVPVGTYTMTIHCDNLPFSNEAFGANGVADFTQQITVSQS